MRLRDDEIHAKLREFRKNPNKPFRHPPLPEAEELTLRHEYEDFDTEADHTAEEWTRHYAVHELWHKSYLHRVLGNTTVNLRPAGDVATRLQTEIERLAKRVADLETRIGL